MNRVISYRQTRMRILLAALVLVLCLLALHYIHRPTLLVNAQILTMNSEHPVADALLVEGRYITAIGRQNDLERRLPFLNRTIDLQGASIVPGFVDAHSHFPSSGLASSFLNLTPPPVGDVGNLDTLLRRVAEYASSRKRGEWIVGFNYDDASLAVQRHPTREELDRVTPHHPVYLWHRSGHMGVANSLALAELGHTDSNGAEVPFGESPFMVGRDSEGALNGLLQEGAAPRLGKLLLKLPLRELLAALLDARDEYLQAGVTTVQNGFADILSMRLLYWSQRMGIIPQRLVVWPAYEKVAGRMNIEAIEKYMGLGDQVLNKALAWRSSADTFSLSALKLSVDGSPQGRTAWLTEPYLTSGGRSAGYRGFPAISPKRFKAQVRVFHEAGVRLALHGNGDAAIDLIIDALEDAQQENQRPESGHIVVHGQTIREDQLPRLQGLGASVTFFPTHTFFWGDWYRNAVLGQERAVRISPLALADEHKLPYSLHSDAPVTPVNPMQILWSATRRETLSGYILGAEYTVSRMRALRAMTLDAARQNGLQDDRGSLEVGKFADFVVLSGDPLTVPDVRDIAVKRVWIDGREEYSVHAGR